MAALLVDHKRHGLTQSLLKMLAGTFLIHSIQKWRLNDLLELIGHTLERIILALGARSISKWNEFRCCIGHDMRKVLWNLQRHVRCSLLILLLIVKNVLQSQILFDQSLIFLLQIMDGVDYV